MDYDTKRPEELQTTGAVKLQSDISSIGDRLLMILNDPSVISQEKYGNISSLKNELRGLQETIKTFLKDIA